MQRVLSGIFASTVILWTAAHALGAVSIIAGTGSKMLKPQPTVVLLSDTTLDLAAGYSPGGPLKDAVFAGVKKYISFRVNNKTSVVEDMGGEMCKKSDY